MGSYVWPILCEHVTSAKASCPSPVALLGCKSLLEMCSGSLAFETGIAVTDVVEQVKSTKRHESHCSLGDWKSPNLGHPVAQVLEMSPHSPASAASVLPCLIAQTLNRVLCSAE